MDEKVRVVIIDDDQLVSVSLKTILEVSGEIEIVAIGHDGTEALTLYEQYKPDVLVMDIRMKDMTGLAAGQQVIEHFSEAKILLLTTFNDDEYIVKALNIGAKGYILKQDFEGITAAVLAVSRGQTVFGGDVISRIPKLINEPGSHSNDDYSKYDINEKELAIMSLVADGYNNKEIAEELFLSEGTVRNYLSLILEKLELRDRTQLAVFYLMGKSPH